MTTLVARPQRARHAGEKAYSIGVAHQRLMVLMLLFLLVGGVIGTRLVALGFMGSDDVAARVATGLAGRVDIVDRNGDVLARTIEAWSIGVHPKKLLGRPEEIAPQLARLMPERTEAQYLAILTSGTNFTYLRRRALPDLVAAVNALGSREWPMRANPSGFIRRPRSPRTSLAIPISTATA